MDMKKNHLIALIAIFAVVVLASCGSTKAGCAAYDRIEVPQNR
jgi:hypothetical protein